MDPSAFLEVEYGDDVDIVEDEEPLTDLTEDDIVLVDSAYEDNTTLGSKRPPPNNAAVSPPSKKMKKTSTTMNNSSPKVQMNSKFTPVNPHYPKPKVMTPGPLVKHGQLSVTRRPGQMPGPNQQSHSIKPKVPQQSITWKYRPLGM